MMKGRIFFILLFICCLFCGCAATPEPTWRAKATSLVDELERQGAAKMIPSEYYNLVETFEHGEAILFVQKDDKEADTHFLLVLQKGEILKAELKRFKEHLAEEARRKAFELAEKEKEERLMREAAEAEARLAEKERIKYELEKTDKPAQSMHIQPKTREYAIQLPVTHTVRRGETLPQIAARTEIYNDASLWPIIYRANRDQIRDPKQLWPGQVLGIPRHVTKNEELDAKRFSGKK